MLIICYHDVVYYESEVDIWSGDNTKIIFPKGMLKKRIVSCDQKPGEYQVYLTGDVNKNENPQILVDRCKVSLSWRSINQFKNDQVIRQLQRSKPLLGLLHTQTPKEPNELVNETIIKWNDFQIDLVW